MSGIPYSICGHRWLSAAVFVLTGLLLTTFIANGLVASTPDAAISALPATAAGNPEALLSAGGGHNCRLKPNGSADCWRDGPEAEDQIGPFTELSAGSGHSCGLKPNGSVDCWGSNDYGEASDKAGPFAHIDLGGLNSCGLTPIGDIDCWGEVFSDPIEHKPGPFTQVSTGVYHVCGLKPDGSVDCWGHNTWGQSEDNPGPFTQISAGYGYNCGLKTDGRAACWGNNAPSVEGDETYSQLTVGASHTCGLRADGSVNCWGDDSHGQAADQNGPFAQISAGWWHTCGLQPDGGVDCWGWNNSGQVEDQPVPFITLNSVIGTGDHHTCALKPDGSVDCWGATGLLTDFGQAEDQDGPFVMLGVGSRHTCALKANGSVECWGYNLYGQANDQAGPYMQISAGDGHTCALRPDGSAVCWGKNSYGQSNDKSGPFVQINVGGDHSCALRPDGQVDCWGKILSYGQSNGNGGPFIQVVAGGNHTCGLRLNGSVTCGGLNLFGQATNRLGPYTRIDAGSDHTCGLLPTGAVDCWGRNNNGQSTAQSGPFVEISAAKVHTCGLTSDGRVDCWGDNSSGQATDQAGPSGPLALNSSRILSAGARHTCGLKPDGSIDCWGDNEFGQAAGQPGPFTQVSAGGAHTCGLKPGGSIACWGNNEFGQAAVQPGPFTFVSAGGAHTCGLKPDGSADCWGMNDWGQASDQPGPFVEIRAGGSGSLDWTDFYASCGLRADGSIDCWGGDMYQPADDYDNQGPFSHMDVGGYHVCGLKPDGRADCSAIHWWANGQDADQPGPFSQVSAGTNHTCGLKATGGVDCWGDNNKGQATDQTGFFNRVSTGGEHTCALMFDGSVDCWGDNTFGQAEDQPGPFGPYIPPGYQPPVAVDDLYSTNQDETLTVGIPGLLANDSHDSRYSLTILSHSNANHGTLALNPDGSFTYQPAPGFHGIDNFTYSANDGISGTNVASATLYVYSSQVYDPQIDLPNGSIPAPSPSDTLFVRASGPTLDKYLYQSDGSISFTVDVDRVVGRTNDEGYLVEPQKLIDQGIVSPKVTLYLSAYDVDRSYAGTDIKAESDHVYVNGRYVGQLDGADNKWHMTRIEIPTSLFKFGVPTCNEYGDQNGQDYLSLCSSAPESGQNEIRIDIDADNQGRYWGVGVDWAAISFQAARPILLVHGWRGSDDTSFPCSEPDQGDGCIYWDANDGKYTYGFRELLNQKGFLTFNTENYLGGEVLPYENAVRLSSIIDMLKMRYGVDKINIVAHSKGGLDSRAYISSSLNDDDDIAALITLASPHHGSYLALVNGAIALGIPFYDLTPATVALTELFADTIFNPMRPARPGVRYYSVGADAGKTCKFLWYRWLCADNDQQDAYPYPRVVSGILFQLLARHGAYVGTNDFAVALRSTRIIWSVPGHTSSNTTEYTYNRNHDSIKSAILKRGEKDTTLIDLIGDILNISPQTGARSDLQSAVLQAREPANDTGATLGLEQGSIAEGQTVLQPVGVDSETELSFLLTWKSGDLQLNLIDPNGRLITPSTVDPNIVYGEDYDDDPYTNLLLTGKSAGYSIYAPIKGQWQVQIVSASQLPDGTANWTLLVVQDSQITVSLIADKSWTPLNSSVRITSEVKDGSTPVTDASVIASIYLPDGTNQNLTLHDDGAHGDGAAADGVYGNSFVGPQFGLTHLAAKATGTRNGIPFSRTALSQIQVASGTASISGAFSDEGIDTTGDGLLDIIRVNVPVSVATAGEFTAYAELQSGTGTVLARANATASLIPGQRTLALDFNAEEIWSNGGSGRFKLTNLNLLDMSTAVVPVQIDFKPSPYTTKNYNPDNFQHPDIYLTGVTDDYGVDTNGNDKFDELVVKVEVWLENGGNYAWQARLVGANGVEFGAYATEADLVDGVNTLAFHFEGNAIGTSQQNGPYDLVDFDLWGDGGFHNAPNIAQTKPYSFRLFESSPAGADLYLPALFR